MKQGTNRLDRLGDSVAGLGGGLAVLMGLLAVYEVVARYCFNSPTLWVWPVNQMLFGVFVLMAGPYAARKRAHMRIEVLYDRFGPRMRFISNVVSVLAVVLLLGTLTWQLGVMALNAVELRELRGGAFRIPLYPFKVAIAVGSLVFLGVALTSVWDHE